jgi:hypothetical protein
MRNNKTHVILQTKVTRKKRSFDNIEKLYAFANCAKSAHQGSAIGRSSRRIFWQEQFWEIEILRFFYANLTRK